MTKPLTVDDKPHDRLTDLANKMVDRLLSATTKSEDVRAIVFLTDGNDAGIGMLGHDLETGMVDAVLLLKKLALAQGKEVKVFPVQNSSTFGTGLN